MTTKTKPEKKEVIWTSQEKENHKSEYGCEIIVENGTLEQVSTTNAPTDACIVTYEYNEKVCRDLTRGSRVHLFDMYYDKFKTGLKIIFCMCSFIYESPYCSVKSSSSYLSSILSV